ncbi:hypothetical protein Q75_14635 [Bacillus coahuilensis p1.1.43]|uniref:Carboxylic ester hydrolase n=1 Tax=Bacillus coahuilensis p1.1.43 TaxID=1150625 RepID=A0A147K522_9BACI|nr:alpha/beta fold hydrolase [Bacillus coahuilensis]KUP04691.1 hypothetical protein Q75_14635 [Bacillus coahuilensis p1.1.43]
MKTLELAFIALAILVALSLFVLPITRPYVRHLGGVCLLILAICQIVVEGYRWQMIPSYILGATILLLMTAKPTFTSSRSKVFFILFLVLWVPVSIILPIAVPVFTLPYPTGPYDTAKTMYHLTDSNRDERVTLDESDKRELMVSIWYPTTEQKQQAGRYIDMTSTVQKSIAEHLEVPSFLLEYINHIQTHSVKDSTVAESQEKFPIIILSHGLPGNSMMYTSIAENLASHGFVVAAIDHTYYSNLTIFPDDNVTFSKAILPEPFKLEKWDDIISSVWVKDQQYIVDFVHSLDNDPSFAGKLDFNSIGVLGHSFGGAASYQTLLADERIRAAVNMDGTFFGKIQDIPTSTKPYLYMKVKEREKVGDQVSIEEELTSLGLTVQQFNELTTSLHNRQQIYTNYGAYEATFTGLKHMSFNDFYLYSPILSIADKVNVREDHNMINWLLVQFFNKTLYNNDTTIFDNGENPYTRITITHPNTN